MVSKLASFRIAILPEQQKVNFMLLRITPLVITTKRAYAAKIVLHLVKLQSAALSRES